MASKIVLLTFETTKEPWALLSQELYTQKIQRFCPFEIIKIKSPSSSRESKDLKKVQERDLLKKKLLPGDLIVILDERGKSFTSEVFSKTLQNLIDRSPKRIVFIIGGAYGIHEDILSLGHLKVSLSTFVFNHHVAITALLEQIFRAFCIQKNIPYHNE